MRGAQTCCFTLVLELEHVDNEGEAGFQPSTVMGDCKLKLKNDGNGNLGRRQVFSV